MIKNILLDMDGCIADFFSSALRQLNRKYRKDNPISEKEYREYGRFDMAALFGISRQEFWAAIESDQYFWINIHPYPWASSLVRFLGEFAPVTIASSPHTSRICIADKVEWLDKKLGIKSDQCMFGSRKYLMANSETFLIDDLQSNVDDFVAHGGKGVCIPSNWNTENLDFSTIAAKIIKGGLA